MEKRRGFFNIKKGKGYKIQNKTKEADIYIYDEISTWGVNASELVKEINSLKNSVINIHINSPGGSVFDGTTIFNAIKQHKSKTVVYVDGLAASIASVIAMAADEVRMAKNAFLMIHEPWSLMAGNAEDMRKEADLLDKIRGTIVQTYIDKTKADEDQVLLWMSDETWFTADEALEYGFADNIYEEKEVEAKLKLFDLQLFSKVPKELKDSEGQPTVRDMEQALKNVGVNAKEAKSILSKGVRDESDTRDAVKPEDEKEIKRDAEQPQNGSTADLLIKKARMMANSPCQD